MTSVVLLPSFVADLQQQADANFARRVFLKLFSDDGKFREDANDHRYKGIPNAWIRYVSRGTTAFRVIYLREGDQVRVYRAGGHSVEDNLVAPNAGDGSVGVQQGNAGAPAVSKNPVIGGAPSPPSPGRIICSLRGPTLLQSILSRRLIPHTEVALVSPFLTHSLLGRNAKLGRLIDDFIEDGSRVLLITRPPDSASLPVFEDLEARGVELHFHARLHAKLYAFTVDRSRDHRYRDQRDDFYVLGSANLTTSGFAGAREAGNEELSYALPTNDREEIESFLASLAIEAVDLIHLRVQASRQRKNA